jgi:hypothetical protein
MPGSVYKSREGEAEIRALYDEATDGLGLRYENLTFGIGSTRSPSGSWAAIGKDIRVRRATLR